MSAEPEDETDRLLRHAAQKAFIDAAGPITNSLRECIDATVNYLKPGSAGDLLVDGRAVLCGTIQLGETISDQSSTPLWLLEWLRQHHPPLPLHPVDREQVRILLKKGADVFLHRDLRKATLGTALQLARATAGSNQVSLRHLIMALARPGPEWDGLVSPPLDEKSFAALRAFMVEHIIADTNLDDDEVAWRDYLHRNALADEAEADQAGTQVSARQGLRTLSDHPAATDAFGRRAFAQVLGMRLRWARSSDNPEAAGGLMAHIHGAWGYGKTSFLNFLREDLQSHSEPWLVVTFDAWKHHRLRPPWWSLICSVYRAALGSSDFAAKLKLRRIWWGWRLRADWLPILLVAALLTLLAFGVVRAFGSGDAPIVTVTAALSAAAGMYAYVRYLVFGSTKAADIYTELKTDPYEPVIGLYCRLITAVRRPVAIFIDDLDRCEAAYVVELIEGIQNLLRSEEVTYVIAAERKWVCSSFEKRYDDFSRAVGEPARPLGYLFLDKLFQISTSLPALTQRARDEYWRHLLEAEPASEGAGALELEHAKARVSGKSSLVALQETINEAPVSEHAALRAAAALEISRPASLEATEHALQRLAPLLERNPRAMKRLVNAVGLAQARTILEARDVPLETLARWTLIELRWPLIADYLSDHPDTLGQIETGRGSTTRPDLPPHIGAVVESPEFSAVIAPLDDAGLDETGLRALLS